jgi:hypothetical protein
MLGIEKTIPGSGASVNLQKPSGGFHAIAVMHQRGCPVVPGSNRHIVADGSETTEQPPRNEHELYQMSYVPGVTGTAWP